MKLNTLHLDVLGYREDGGWIALALDMDLRGYGASFDEALADLGDLIRMQVSFAMQKDAPELIYKPAEPLYHEIFKGLKVQALGNMVRKGVLPPSDSDYQIGDLVTPDLSRMRADDGEFAAA